MDDSIDQRPKRCRAHPASSWRLTGMMAALPSGWAAVSPRRRRVDSGRRISGRVRQHHVTNGMSKATAATTSAPTTATSTSSSSATVNTTTSGS